MLQINATYDAAKAVLSFHACKTKRASRGPAEVLARMPDAEVAFVWKTLEPITSDVGIKFLPDATIYDDVSYDMIVVPGGFACTNLMVDQDVLSWLTTQAESAQYITSVCTGSLVLAAAGLLNGYKAGCH